jgi:hypothetical protein
MILQPVCGGQKLSASEGRDKNMSANVLPISFQIGPAGSTTIVAVDDAWFEGNSHDNVLPLDRIVGIRQRTSLEDLLAHCKGQAATHSLGDLVYLQCLAEFCLQHRFRLSLCNFEHAESTFADLNQAGQAALFDVNYANVKDQDYGPNLLARKLNGRKPKADMFVVTGYRVTYSDLLDKHAHDPLWWPLRKWVSPIIGKGEYSKMQKEFRGFALNFAARTGEERFQFWARFGDENWTIVFNGRPGNNPNIDVETTYLAVLVAHPNINIHPVWLDTINEAGNAKGKSLPKHMRLFISAWKLARMHDLSRPPSPAESVTAAKPSTGLDDLDGKASIDAEDHTSGEEEASHQDQALPVGAPRPLPDGCHSEAYLAQTPTGSADLQIMLDGYKKRLPKIHDVAKRKGLEAAIVEFEKELELKMTSGGFSTGQTSSEFAKLKWRVFRQYARARKAFSKLEVNQNSVIAALRQHFAASLPKGEPRKPMVLRYSPPPNVTWTCTPPD